MRSLVVALVLAALPTVASAQAVYPSSPDWVSADTRVSTGAALVDLDGDGWLDLVVANGNDMQQQPLAVYHNQGDGTLPASPTWLSADVAYHGHLDVADVNGDGWPDVAVAVLGSFDDVDHAAKIYLNNAGTLTSTPAWESAEMANAFGCAFGDVDNDGRPDLAVATGWAYDPQNFYPNYVYLNSGGTLSSSASWTSTDTTHLQGVLWVDSDRDGWLDLVGVAAGANSLVYPNQAGALATTASWQTTDMGSADAIMAASGDVTGDGLRDLVLADNDQLAGSGRFRLYAGLPGGSFATTVGWSYYDGYASAVAMADVDADGDLDLATGAWWDRVRLFLQGGAGLPSSPSWSSTPQTVVEKIVFGDVDRRGPATAAETFPAGGRLLELARQPVEAVTAVEVDGVPLGPSQYAVGRDLGWVTVGVDPVASVRVEYRYSSSLDMAVTNWDDTVGNHLYYNQLDPPLFADGFESGGTGAWGAAAP